MSFHVGQKVVCVDAGHHGIISNGSIYTISWISPPGKFMEAAIWLQGLGPRGEDGGLFAWRFRPLDERKTDISIFTVMLDTSKTKVPA